MSEQRLIGWTLFMFLHHGGTTVVPATPLPTFRHQQHQSSHTTATCNIIVTPDDLFYRYRYRYRI